MTRALPLVLAIAAFGIGVNGDFVLDDHNTIVENPVVQGTVPAAAAFSRNAWGRPPGRGGRRPPPWRIAAAAAAFAAALLCKESAILFPLVVAILIESEARRHPERSALLRRHAPTIALGATLAVVLALRLRVVPLS